MNIVINISKIINDGKILLIIIILGGFLDGAVAQLKLFFC